MKLFVALSPLLWAAGEVLAGKLSPTDTTTWGGDNSRSGYQTGHNMDPSVVGGSQFGQLWKAALPGNYRGEPEQIFSQPLVYTLDDGIQYVFLATTQNNVYKLNAKTGAIVASRRLHVPFLTADLDGCVDINPTIGVTATGVIDPSTDTWYLTAKTYVDQTDTTKGRLNGRYFFHAIDVNTLDEKPGFPKPLEGTIARNSGNRMFQGGNHHQRPALLLTGRYVYAGFASHCVQYNFTGWVMGWDKTTGNLVEKFTTEAGPEPNKTPGGGIWMSGGGLASDDKGSMYYATGNGYASQLAEIPVPGRQPPTSLEQAAVNMKINDDGSLQPVDFFIPWEKQQLDGADKDLGTSPLQLLPTDVFSCPTAKRLGIVTGKSGKTYLLNIDDLGGYRNGDKKLDAIPQSIQHLNSVYAGVGVYPLEGGYISVNVVQFPTRVYKFSCSANGNPQLSFVAETAQKNGYIIGVGHGTTTSLNGQAGTGLMWISDVEGFQLRVYKAVPQGGAMELIYSSNIPGVTKFSRPVFGDGRVYLGTTKGLLYCYGSPVNLPLTCTSPNDFGTVPINSTSAARTIQCKANVNVQITDLVLTGNPNFKVTEKPTLPATVAAGTSISFKAVFIPGQPGSLSSDVLINSVNQVAGYSTSTPVSLKGVGTSVAPLLAISPNVLSFSGVIVGEQEGGVTESATLVNRGDSPLTISNIEYSIISETGATTTPEQTANGPKVGPFTFQNLPKTIAANSESTININFNPSTSGNFAVYVRVLSDGGRRVFDVVGTAGTYPKAQLEFEAKDGSGWVPYTQNSPPFTFGDVFQQNTKTLKMRLTNNGASSAGSLSVTVSKPPFGVSGIIGAKNGVDLGEGTILNAGRSATADLYCSVPKSQVNVDAYNGTALWTMNTGDPAFGKQLIQFTCNAVSEQVGPLHTNGSAKYRYVGCFKENNPGRQLKTQIYSSIDNTNAKCITACAAAGWAFAGTQYHRECWCGNTSPSQITTEADCNFDCAGNLKETCGGDGVPHTGSFISLFSNGLSGASTDPPPPPVGGPKVVPSVGLYTYAGCYSEATNGRALSGKASSSADMTVQKCAATCSGFSYFGTEYANECYCGNTLGAGSIKKPETDCSAPCAGNSSQICGNGNRLTLYHLSSSASLSASAAAVSSSLASSSTSTVESASPTSSSAPSTIVSSSSASSAVVSSSSTSSVVVSSSSAPSAAVSSSSASSTAVSSPSASSPAVSSSAVPSSSASSTVVSSPSASSLASLSASSTSVSSASASSAVVSSASVSTAVSESVSSSSASSAVTSAAVITSSIGSSVSGFVSTRNPFTTAVTEVSTTTSAVPTPTGPVHVQSAGNFNFSGCYTEGSKSRALTEAKLFADDMTVGKCANFCAAYKFMGVEYGSECYCGNSIRTGSVNTKLSDCSMLCKGSRYEFCGAGGRLDLYSSTGGVIAPEEPIIVQGNVNFTYTGCYLDSSNERALANLISANSQMTVERCLGACSQFTYAGLEYGSECWCGNKLNPDSAKAVTEDECDKICPGNSTQICGAGNRLTLYTRRPAVFGLSSSQSSSIMTSASQASSSIASSSATSQVPSASSSVTSTVLSSTSPTSSLASISSSATSVISSSIFSTSSQLSSSSTPSASSSSSTPTASSSSSTPTASSSNSTPLASSTGSASSVVSSSSSSSLSSTSDSATSVFSSTVSASSSQVSSSIVASVTSAGPSSGSSLSASSSLSSTASSVLSSPSSAISTTSLTASGFTTSTRSTASSSTISVPSSIASTSSTSSVVISTSVSSTAKSTTASSTPSRIVPTPGQTIDAQVYLGCANQTSPRALVGMSKTDTKKMTTETCQALCLKNNYGLSALENGNTCFCGNGLQSYSALGQTSCDAACVGNATQTCGGIDSTGKKYLSVWNNTATIPPTIVKQVSAYPLLSCYVDAANTPLLNDFTFSSHTDMSVESCVAQCSARNFPLAGLRYGKSCFCGASIPSGAKKVLSKNCNMLCTGNNREFCGAYARLLVYQYTAASVDSNGVPKAINQGNSVNVVANTTAPA